MYFELFYAGKIFYWLFVIFLKLEKAEIHTEEDGTIGEETLPCPMGQGNAQLF